MPDLASDWIAIATLLATIGIFIAGVSTAISTRRMAEVATDGNLRTMPLLIYNGGKERDDFLTQIGFSVSNRALTELVVEAVRLNGGYLAGSVSTGTTVASRQNRPTLDSAYQKRGWLAVNARLAASNSGHEAEITRLVFYEQPPRVFRGKLRIELKLHWADRPFDAFVRELVVRHP